MFQAYIDESSVSQLDPAMYETLLKIYLVCVFGNIEGSKNFMKELSLLKSNKSNSCLFHNY